MFTRITLSTVTSGFYSVGDKIVSVDTGATGIIQALDSSNNYLFISDVNGTFVEGNDIQTYGRKSTGTSGSAIQAVRPFNIEDARSVAQSPSDSSDGNFTANIILDNDKIISGSTNVSTNGSITGIGTAFLTELRPGDVILDGNGTEQVIDTVTDNSNAQTVATSGVTVSNQVALIRRRAKLYNQDQSASIFAWPRDYVKEHTPTLCTVRKQEEFNIDANGQITITKSSDETFSAVNNDNYQFAVIKAGSGSSPQRALGNVLKGDDVTITGTTSKTVTIGNADDQNGRVRASWTVIIANPN